MARILSGLLLGIVASFLINVFPRINERLVPIITWFPVPVLAIALVWLWSAHRTSRKLVSYASLGTRMWIFALAAAALLATLGLTLTGWDFVVSGRATLPGDAYVGSAQFKAVCSLVIGLAAGFVEEAVVRGHVQLPLEPAIGTANSQLIAGAMFIGLHALTGVGFGQLIQLVAVSAVCGLLTWKFRLPLPAAIAHGLSNLGIAATVLSMRS